MAKPWTVEQRYPTRRARDFADAEIEKLAEDDPMWKYIDVWLASYRVAGGIEKRSVDR